MKILFLAPQPFFQERGTPIAVRLALEVIAERFQSYPENKKFDIDLLCYHEGIDLEMPGVNIIRIRPPGFLRKYLGRVTPGISLKKLICDIFFAYESIRLIFKHRKQQYDLVHAVEESVFLAVVFKFLLGIPYIYDMDSSLALQLTEKWIIFKPLYLLLSWFEKLAIKNSAAVAPVCDSLGIIAEKYGAKNMVVLRDISLLKGDDSVEKESLKRQLAIPDDSKIILYVGNLETYQGIDLLIASFGIIQSKIPDWYLVVIGGNVRDIELYQEKAKDSLYAGRLIFAGPRPVAMLGNYIKQADILVSPRTKGNNTPMKIYSYLHSGKALLATDLPTHTQVLNENVCLLVPAESDAFSQGMLALANNEPLRMQLAARAFELAEKNYTFSVFSKELNRLYDNISGQIDLQQST